MYNKLPAIKTQIKTNTDTDTDTDTNTDTDTDTDTHTQHRHIQGSSGASWERLVRKHALLRVRKQRTIAHRRRPSATQRLLHPTIDFLSKIVRVLCDVSVTLFFQIQIH